MMLNCRKLSCRSSCSCQSLTGHCMCCHDAVPHACSSCASRFSECVKAALLSRLCSTKSLLSRSRVGQWWGAT